VAVSARRFPLRVLAAFKATRYLHIRSGDHRFILIWVVVVDDRVIVRSWNDKASGWYRAFLSGARGDVRIGDRELPVRAVPVRSERLNNAADRAYAAKYTSRADAKYVEGFKSARRKASTLELLPTQG
jgi:hypothetical protein